MCFQNAFGTYITAVIDESGEVSTFGRINDVLTVHSEQIRAADSTSFVVFLPYVGHRVPHNLTNVLNDHLLGSDRFQGKQSPGMDARLCKLQVLLTEL